jgi:hypothetical protein
MVERNGKGNAGGEQPTFRRRSRRRVPRRKREEAYGRGDGGNGRMRMPGEEETT